VLSARKGHTSEIDQDAANVLDVGREADLTRVHLVLFARLVLDNYSSAYPDSSRAHESVTYHLGAG
jgi:hypothetical protein